MYGQLGDGTNATKSAPTDVVGLTSGVVAITASNGRTCAVTAVGGVKCWGLNARWQLGDGTQINRNTPVDVVGLAGGATSIGSGSGGTCAVVLSGLVQCWDTSGMDEPLDIGAPAATVAVGFLHHCALTTAGGAKCWGTNDRGQVGKGSSTRLDYGRQRTRRCCRGCRTASPPSSPVSIIAAP